MWINQNFIWSGAHVILYSAFLSHTHHLCDRVLCPGFWSKRYRADRSLPFYFKPNGLGFGLLGVYAIWLLVVVLLYPICKMYDRNKTAYAKEKRWLSYI